MKYNFLKYKLYLEEDISKEEIEKAKKERRYVGKVMGYARWFDSKERKWKMELKEFHMITDEKIDERKHWFLGVDRRYLVIGSQTISSAAPFVGARSFYHQLYDWDTHSFRKEEVFHMDYALEFKVKRKGQGYTRYFLPMFLCEKKGMYGYYDVNMVVEDYLKHLEEVEKE